MQPELIIGTTLVECMCIHTVSVPTNAFPACLMAARRRVIFIHGRWREQGTCIVFLETPKMSSVWLAQASKPRAAVAISGDAKLTTKAGNTSGEPARVVPNPNHPNDRWFVGRNATRNMKPLVL
jgi:hypothetical protein